MRHLNALADRILRVLVPADVKAAAACPPESWTETEFRACPGGLRICRRTCRVLPSCSYSCGAWSCGGCNLE
ncbi:hypothetical protein AB0I28_07420 [Phytomonospora sp. NPDC050363]|uniref:hypothetical protein n=1 Tax=Phytomonospora sp. NPDC050363 TaxID=3155642 RepID=UPI003406784E